MKNMEEIKLNIGESTRIICKGLGTAGYLWNYNIDHENLISISKDLVMPSSSKKLSGSSADEVFTITANKKGVVNIYFFQKRSWEEKPANERRVRVEVG